MSRLGIFVKILGNILGNQIYRDLFINFPAMIKSNLCVYRRHKRGRHVFVSRYASTRHSAHATSFDLLLRLYARAINRLKSIKNLRPERVPEDINHDIDIIYDIPTYI